MAKITRRFLALVCAGVGAAACVSPTDAAEAASGTRMPIGSPVRPPPGFLELCSRAPQHCIAAEAADAGALAEVRSHALSQYWSAVFPSIGAPASSGPGSVHGPASPIDAGSPPPGAPGEAFSWDDVARVNREVNGRIKHGSDARTYGRGDYWAVPTGPFPRGDCEDYVLAKRVALTAVGVPAERLSIALVETRWGESHAVLLLAADDGDYVLDNLEPRILHWTQAPYVWRERQLPGQPLAWVEVKPPRA